MSTSPFYLSVGDSVTVSRTVSEADVYLFAGVTGDLSPNHVDAEFMARSAFKQRVAHGALLVGFMSAASTKMVGQSREVAGRAEKSVALGYDRIRFLRPVFFGDTVTVNYRITEVDEIRRRTTAEISVANQRNELVCAAIGLLKWVPVQQDAESPG